MHKIKATHTAINRIKELDAKSRTEITAKINTLAIAPGRGIRLKGPLSDYSSMPVMDGKYSIIYKDTANKEIIIYCIITNTGDEQKEIYSLLKKMVKLKLID